MKGIGECLQLSPQGLSDLGYTAQPSWTNWHAYPACACGNTKDKTDTPLDAHRSSKPSRCLPLLPRTTTTRPRPRHLRNERQLRRPLAVYHQTEQRPPPPRSARLLAMRPGPPTRRRRAQRPCRNPRMSRPCWVTFCSGDRVLRGSRGGEAWMR